MKIYLSQRSTSVFFFFTVVVSCFVSSYSNAQFEEVKNTPFGFQVYHQLKNGSFVLLSDTSFIDEMEDNKHKISKEELVELFVSINGGLKLKGTYTGEMVKITTSEGKFQVPNGLGVITGEVFEYSGSFNKGLMHGTGKFIYNKESYDGQFVNGKRNGTGKMIFSNGDEYKGNWTNDVIEGNGRMIYGVFYQDNSKMYAGEYDGQWVKGKKNGYGISLWNGDYYTGNWLNDKRNGSGELSFYQGRELIISEVGGLNAVRFTGEWYNDSITGVGELTYFESIIPEDKKQMKEEYERGMAIRDKSTNSDPEEISLTKKGPLTWNGFNVSGEVDVRFTNGNSFKGTLVEGKMLKGKLFFLLENTNVLGHKNGTWENGKFSGQAKIPYSVKSSYTGEIKSDKKNCLGKMIYEDGTSYEGNWINDMKNGQGKYIDTKGNVFTGVFADDKCTGTAQIKNAEWSYQGEVSNYQPSGKGVKIYSNGDTLSGTWNEFGFNGIGKRREAAIEGSDEFYFSEGTWENGQLNGEGKRFFKIPAPYADLEDDIFLDATYTGQFKNGVFHGKGNLEFNDMRTWFSIEGDWINGLCPNGQMNDYFTAGDEHCETSYKGDLSSDFNKQGFGTYIDCDGSTYVGHFVNDSKNGEGKLTYKNGKIEQGTFVNNVFQIPFICKQVTIGNQVWMAENLTVVKFRNGELIPQIKTSVEWQKASNSNTPGWCYYEFNPANAKYGKLYNWYAVNDPRGLAPLGWHIPSKDEYYTMFGSYGQNMEGSNFMKNALKSKVGWKDNGNNQSGFNGLPAGIIDVENRFWGIGEIAYYWTSTCCLAFNSSATALQLDSYTCSLGDNNSKSKGFSVRCVQNSYKSHEIGDFFEGGIIFDLWVDANGAEHGLIVDLVDLKERITWSNVLETEVGASAQSYDNGLGNCNAIVNQRGHQISAVSLCLNSTNGGQNDWYLPSINEVQKLFNQFTKIQYSLANTPGGRMLTTQIDSDDYSKRGYFYWLSTEYPLDNTIYRSHAAYVADFGSNDTRSRDKVEQNGVRAIRKF